MSTQSMTSLHQAPAPWAWSLAPREVRTLAAEGHTRWLRLDDGCLWVTRRDSHGQREDDIWLCPGDSLVLPAGSEWLVEAWPQARLSLLQQAPVKPVKPARRTISWPWLRGVLHA